MGEKRRESKFERLNRKICGWIEWIGFGALFLMVILTCVDVIGAKFFRTPVFGALDIMMLAQLIAVSFAGAMAMILGWHVQVEFFMILFPKRIQAAVDCFVALLCLVLFVCIVWRLFAHGYDLKIGGEETATARIPVFPFAYASAAAMIPFCLIFIQKLIDYFLKVVKNES
jgi:TRAP-type C4-dicarboxylate transport system permease small subunit